MKNEKTGAVVAGLAGAFLEGTKDVPGTHEVIAVNGNVRIAVMAFLAALGLGKGSVAYLGSVSGLKKVAASALTQSADLKRKK